jgi:hypothetical protein
MILLRLALSIAILSAGCSDAARRSPTAATTAATPAPTPPVEPGVAPPFPAVSRPARVYEATADSRFNSYNGGTLKMRYVLYDDFAFALQFSSPRFRHTESRGTYTESNGEVIFQWERSIELRGATAIITEESLTVSYSLMMQHSDFEDGVFVRVRD